MDILRALFFVALVAAPGCSSLPTTESPRSVTNSLIYITQTALMHIKKLITNLPVPSLVEFSTPSITGLTSISHDLGLFINELQSPHADLILQIHTDVSSLEGLVRYYAQTMNCTIQDRPQAHAADHPFPDSHISRTLVKLKLYLENLLLHKDKFKVC
ncbi:leptin-B-like [Cheilinus undulatus]|uniref:leptin-B-like n=1 Tax=Cheilinus undulatus TaxID=241271 RepID=UPI001BD4BBA7|nr:leptin-B-like [Cheilinus undulatus]